MARPITITWPAASANSLAVSQFFAENVPLIFSNPVYAPNPNNFGSLTGSNLALVQNLFPPMQVSPQVLLPAGNVRRVMLYSAGNLSSVEFIILGMSYGQIFSELLIGPHDSYAISENYYQRLIAVIPLFLVGGEVSVGFSGGGQTEFLSMDIWNKASSFTIAYNVLTSEDGETLDPFYMVNSLNQFPNGQVTNPYLEDDGNINLDYAYAFPYQNANFIISPNAATFPSGSDISLSSVGLPLTAIGTQVASATPSTSAFSFIQTIVQQGGKF